MIDNLTTHEVRSEYVNQFAQVHQAEAEAAFNRWLLNVRLEASAMALEKFGDGVANPLITGMARHTAALIREGKA